MCRLRIATNTRRKQRDGSWGDKANYFTVVVFGAQVAPVVSSLSKGSPVAIDGRLELSEWASPEGEKRQEVQIVADAVQFLAGRGPSARQDSSESKPPDEQLPY